jgi:hypothetical protein
MIAFVHRGRLEVVLVGSKKLPVLVVIDRVVKSTFVPKATSILKEKFTNDMSSFPTGANCLAGDVFLSPASCEGSGPSCCVERGRFTTVHFNAIIV